MQSQINTARGPNAYQPVLGAPLLGAPMRLCSVHTLMQICAVRDRTSCSFFIFDDLRPHLAVPAARHARALKDYTRTLKGSSRRMTSGRISPGRPRGTPSSSTGTTATLLTRPSTTRARMSPVSMPSKWLM